jgi:nitrogen PTS system EIIA component
MRMNEFLAPEYVIVDVRAGDKAKLLNDLSSRAAKALCLAAEDVAAEILKREELGSTGIGFGVSIPHARLRGVKKPFGLLARLKDPIDFDAIDNQPVDIVFLLLLPASSQLDQLNALAAVARKLRDTEVLKSLRRANDRTEIYRVIAE